LDDAVARSLAGLCLEHGDALLDDPARLEAFLRDVCPGSRAEIHCLVLAVREGAVADLREGMPDLPAEAAAERLAAGLRSDLRYDDEAASWTAGALVAALLAGVEKRTDDQVGYCLSCHETVAVAPDGVTCSICGATLIDIRQSHTSPLDELGGVKLPGGSASDSPVDAAAADSAAEGSRLGSAASLDAPGADDDGRQPENQGASSPSALSDLAESVWAFWNVCSTVPVSAASTQSEADPQRSAQSPSGNVTTRDQRQFILGIGGAGTDRGRAILRSLLAGSPDSVVGQAASGALHDAVFNRGKVRVEPSTSPSMAARSILACRRARQMRELGRIYANPTEYNVTVLRILAGGASEIAWHAAQLVADIEGDSSMAVDSALCPGTTVADSSS